MFSALAQSTVFIIILCSPDGHEEHDENWEDHLHVGDRGEAEHAQHEQLRYLQARERVHLPLRHAPDVVVWRVGGL